MYEDGIKKGRFQGKLQLSSDADGSETNLNRT